MIRTVKLIDGRTVNESDLKEVGGTVSMFTGSLSAFSCRLSRFYVEGENEPVLFRMSFLDMSRLDMADPKSALVFELNEIGEPVLLGSIISLITHKEPVIIVARIQEMALSQEKDPEFVAEGERILESIKSGEFHKMIQTELRNWAGFMHESWIQKGLKQKGAPTYMQISPEDFHSMLLSIGTGASIGGASISEGGEVLGIGREVMEREDLFVDASAVASVH